MTLYVLRCALCGDAYALDGLPGHVCPSCRFWRSSGGLTVRLALLLASRHSGA